MIERQRTARSPYAVRIAVASLSIAGGALALAGQATADPEPYPPPAPGQPVATPLEAPVAPPAPPPIGAPPVPEIPNPVYGQGQTGGQLGYLRDLWNAGRSGNPIAAITAPPQGVAPGAPPGAGPAPQLPPGFQSLTAPESSTPGIGYESRTGGPPLPPGYFPVTGPPPPGWYDAPPPADPMSPQGVIPIPSAP